MKKIFIFLMILSITSIVYADRVCLEKSTGELIEYQSGDAPLGTLIENAVNAGYDAEDVEEKYVSQQEWNQLREIWIDKPQKDKEKIKKDKKKALKNKLKTQLNLSNEELDLLFE